MVSIPTLSCLNHQKLNDEMKELLLIWIKHTWNDQAIQYSNDHDHQSPPFDMFAEFVLNQAKKSNHPIARSEGVASVSAGSIGAKGRVMSIQSTRNAESYEVQQDAPVSAARLCTQTPTPNHPTDEVSKPHVWHKEPVKWSPVCLLCEKEHKLYLCPYFAKMPAKANTCLW